MRKKNTRGCNLESASEVIDALGLEDILLLVAVSLEAEELGVLCALDVVPWVCGVTGPGQLVAAEGVAEDVARGHGGAEGNASSEGGELWRQKSGIWEGGGRGRKKKVSV